MRIYDSRVGRFLSTDPLGGKFPFYTPYQFAGNKPIENTDLDGAEEIRYNLTIDKGGKTKLQVIGAPQVYEIHSIFGITLSKINLPERYVVYYNGSTYNIGFQGPEGAGNQDAVNLFKIWKNSLGDAKTFERLFYTQTESILGEVTGNIEKNRSMLQAAILGGVPSGFKDFEPVSLRGNRPGAKQINQEVKKISDGKGTPQLDEDGNPAIFKKRNETKMQRDWDGASEFGVDVPGRSNEVRILRQEVGADSDGNPMYKYGWTDDHYKNIHDIEVKPPTGGK